MANLRHLLPYMARYRLSLLIGLCCAIIGATVSTLSPYVLRLAVDELSTGTILLSSLTRYGGLLLIIALADGLFKFFQRMLIIGTSYAVENDLRRALFARYMQLDQSFFSQNHTGDLMARATNDLSAIRQLLGPGINGSATALFTFSAAALLMLFVNVPLALIVLLLMPLTTLIFILVGNRMRRTFTKVQDQFGTLSTRVQENFSGIRTIKAYAQEEAELAVFAADNAHYRTLSMRYMVLSGALWPLMTLGLGIVAALVLLVGGRLVVAGQLTIGQLAQFNAYLVMLSFPMIMLGWVVSLVQQAAASMDRLLEVLTRKPAITNPEVAIPLPHPRGEITLEGVGVRYTSERSDDRLSPRPAWMLHDISFHVPAGSSLALVGATGAGKTTLVNLLARVRDPDAGRVLIDGIDVRQLDLANLRRAISYVPQETFLFSRSLRENVAFGVDQADHAAIAHATTVSCLANDLDQFPDGIEAMVGERGLTLSGGQKQRVAIARAVLRNPAILVLDDALSSVDTHTSAQILTQLHELLRGRTSIIIAQRAATVRDADQIIVLHDGQIAEHGTHNELLQLGGHYTAMYRRELLEAELTD